MVSTSGRLWKANMRCSLSNLARRSSSACKAAESKSVAGARTESATTIEESTADSCPKAEKASKMAKTSENVRIFIAFESMLRWPTCPYLNRLHPSLEAR